MKYSKILFSFCLLYLISINSYSQVRFGLKLGPNIAYANFKGDGASAYEDFRELLVKYHFEGICILPVNETFKFRLGLGVHAKGHKSVETVNSINNIVEITPIYLQIPIIASYVNDKFHIGAGPYFSFGLSGKYIEKEEGGGVPSKIIRDGSIVFGNTIDSDLRNLDAGLQLEAGFTIKYDWIISGAYNIGLINFYPAPLADPDGISGKFNSFSISIGYLFPY